MLSRPVLETKACIFRCLRAVLPQNRLFWTHLHPNIGLGDVNASPLTLLPARLSPFHRAVAAKARSEACHQILIRQRRHPKINSFIACLKSTYISILSIPRRVLFLGADPAGRSKFWGLRRHSVPRRCAHAKTPLESQPVTRIIRPSTPVRHPTVSTRQARRPSVPAAPYSQNPFVGFSSPTRLPLSR